MNAAEVTELYAGFAKPLLPILPLAVLILVALPLVAMVGYRLGRIEYRRRGYENVSSEKVPGENSLGGMLALVGLLLGFSFSSALGWREARQTALVHEAAAMGTAFLSADLLEEPGRTELKRAILDYARTRVATREDTRSEEAWRAFLERTMSAQARIWPATLGALGPTVSDPVRVKLISSVTAMLDAHSVRLGAAVQQIPPPAKLLLFLASAFGVLIVGNRSALQGRPMTWRTFLFAGLLGIVMIVIIDLDRSLEGMMTVNTITMEAAIDEMEAAMLATRN